MRRSLIPPESQKLTFPFEQQQENPGDPVLMLWLLHPKDSPCCPWPWSTLGISNHWNFQAAKNALTASPCQELQGQQIPHFFLGMFLLQGGGSWFDFGPNPISVWICEVPAPPREPLEPPSSCQQSDPECSCHLSCSFHYFPSPKTCSINYHFMNP